MIGKNNPLNIRYNHLNKWKGQIGQTRGFVDFSDLFYGVRAALYLVKISYARKGKVTISEIISTFAPPSENDTLTYIEFVCRRLKLFPFDAPVTKYAWCELIVSMSIMEGFPITYNYVSSVYSKMFEE